MMMRYDGQVAIVTGAGNGLGRSHALALAARGANVVVNDVGGARDGTGEAMEAAQRVVAEIEAAGGEAMANSANVTRLDEVEAMVQETMARWGRVDILVNNAGILRDKTFANMDMSDFQAVLNVHVMGAANCTKAVWPIMREQAYGRVAMTSSSSGIYGNFGQSNYSAAKMAVVGLMNTLHLEGAKYGIRVNALSPIAATRMTEGLLDSPAVMDLMTVESVTAGLLYLVSQEAPSRLILCAGVGGYAATRIYETPGIYLKPEERTPENIAEHIGDILNPMGQEMFEQGGQQTAKFAAQAAEAVGIAFTGLARP